MQASHGPDVTVHARGLEKSFKDVDVLRGVDFDVALGSPRRCGSMRAD